MKPSATGSERFLWGVSTSGYQAEGGYNGEVQPLNNWAWAEREGRVARSGRSADFWNLGAEDFERCRSLGLNAFRLGLEWSRIQPGYTLPEPGKPVMPPEFDLAALARYAELVTQCRAAGMEPIITLHHFVHPAWLGPDAWLDPATVDHFIAFVDKTLRYLRDVLPRIHGCPPPRIFITINEPNLLAPNHYLFGLFPGGREKTIVATLTCLQYLFEAHARVYQLIHQLYADDPLPPQVGFNNYCSDLYWMDQAWNDLFFVKARGVPREQVFDHLAGEGRKFDATFLREKPVPRTHPSYWFGQGIKRLHHRVAENQIRPGLSSRLLDLIYAAPQPMIDFIGIDYYDPFVAHMLRWPRWWDYEARPRTWREWLLESVISKWWDWRVRPEGLAFFVRHLQKFDRPILIAENGMAYRRFRRVVRRADNFARSVYIRQHVRMTAALRQQGHALMGYLHWSLFDNYEWGSYAPRFGLYSIDFSESTHRYAVDLLGDNPSETYRQEIQEAELMFKEAAGSDTKT